MIDKKLKAVVQGGVDNYLGKQPQVQAPRKWQSSPDKPSTELAYITEAEKDLILKANIHGGLEGGPNMGPSGIMSLDSFGDVGGGGASGGDTSAGGGANEGASFSGRSVAEMNSPRDKAFENRVANEKAALQISERAQANNLGYNERANIANATYGPLQKYTGERGFLGNLFRGANKYGYTDTYTDGPNQGQVKPGYGGRIIGGLASLMTGIPFVGGALGSMYDYGKGIFGPKQRDMSQFNKLGLGGVNPATLDFDPNAQINQDVDTTGYSRFSDASLGKPNINNLESLIAASQGINFNNPVGGLDQFAKEVEALEATRAGEILKANQLGGTLQDFYTNKQPLPPNYSGEIIDDDINFNDGSSQGIMSTTSASDLPAEFQDMATYAGNYSQNAVSKQLYGEEYDVLDPFTQQQIDSLIDQVGTKSTGELAGREV